MQPLRDYTQELKNRQSLISLARIFQCLALTQNDPAAAAQLAGGRREWADNAQLHRVLMAAVPGQSAVGDSSLIPITSLNVMSVIRPLSILDRLPGVVRVPFDTAVTTTLSGSGSAWVGEGKPIPVSKPAYSRIGTLTRLKVSTLCVVAKELVRSADVDAQLTVANDFVRACVVARDLAAIDPAQGGIANVKPASLTFGAPAFASTGVTLAAIDADLGRLMDSLIAKGSTLQSAAWVFDPLALAFLARLRGSGGALAYPGLTMTGGTLFSLPVIVSSTMPNVGSPQSSSIVLIDGSRVWLAQDDSAEVDTSEEASIQQLDNPTNDSVTPTATTVVSMFETVSIALRGNQTINFKIAEAGAAAVLNMAGF